ncbi:hypothetical protein Hanom_Chr17g01556361 [Helianthus anomalus]
MSSHSVYSCRKSHPCIGQITFYVHLFICKRGRLMLPPISLGTGVNLQDIKSSLLVSSV